MLIDGPPTLTLSDEQKQRMRRLAWSTVRKFVLSCAGAVGARVGERVVEWVLDSGGGDDDEEDDGDRPE